MDNVYSAVIAVLVLHTCVIINTNIFKGPILMPIFRIFIFSSLTPVERLYLVHDPIKL